MIVYLLIARENSTDFESVTEVDTQNIGCAVNNQCLLFFLKFC